MPVEKSNVIQAQRSPNLLAVSTASGAVVSAVGWLAWVLQAPVLAPPLGVTAFLCFRSPDSAVSAPRNAVFGHLCGVAAGLLALHVTGAFGMPSAFSGPFTLAHALGSGLAMGLTAAATHVWRCPHPPAAATTLVVSLGLLQSAEDLVAFLVGVFATVAVSHAGRVALGLTAPRWRPLQSGSEVGS